MKKRMDGCHVGRDATLKLVALLNDHSRTHELVQNVTAFLQQWTNCEAVGVRLKEGDDFPYFEARGFPSEFIRLENSLCERDLSGQIKRDSLGQPALECMCGNVLRGRFDPALPFFTARGTFWTNCTTEMLAGATAADLQGRTRNRCNGEGYESVALIRLRCGDETLGLLQFNDHARGRFSPESLDFLENAADQIAIALVQRKTQAALAQSELLYRSLFDHMLNGLAYCRMIIEEGRPPDFVYLSVNEAFETLTGLKEVVGKRASEVIPGIQQSDPQLLETYGRIASSGRPEKFEVYVEGLKMWFAISAYCPQPGHFVAVFEMITERKAAETALRESEQRYRSLVENSWDAVMLTTPDGQILAANTAACEMFQRTQSELQQVGRAGLVDIADERLGQLLDRRARVGRARDELQLLRADGSSFPAEVSSVVFDTPQGPLTTMLIRDITERKRSEAAIREISDRLLVATSAANIGIWDWDVRNDRLMWDDAMHRLYGTDPGQFAEMRKAWESRVHPEDMAQARTLLQAALRGEKELDTAFRVVLPDGSVRHLKANGMVQRDASGQAVRVVGTNWDITELKTLEHELVRRERQLNAFFVGATAGLVLLDKDMRFVQINEALARMNGAPAGEHIGRTVREILPVMAAKVEPIIRGVIATGEPVAEVEVVGDAPAGGGLPRHWLESFFPVKDDDGSVEAVGAIVVEITDRVRAEEALRRSEQRLALAMDAASDGLWDWDVATGQAYVNPRWFAMLGYQPGEILPCYESWRQLLHPRDVATNDAAVSRCMRNEVDSYSSECRVRTKSGQWKWILSRFKVVERDSQGNPLRLVGTNTDMTERKDLEQQLRQAQKLEAIGRVAGGVAHDFRNQLAVIKGYSSMLLRRDLVHEEGREMMAHVVEAADRSAALTGQLLAFSRKQALDVHRVDLVALIADISKAFPRLLGEDIRLVVEAGPDPCVVEIDPGQFGQAMLNLVANARDAMPGGGQLGIETARADLPASVLERHSGAKAGPYVRVTVRDTGCGMDEATMARLFEPFFTTKGVGQGTGLGLAMVYGFVQQSGGFICVHSQPQGGSEFGLYFPCSDKSPEIRKQAPDGGASDRGGCETVLVVEDEDSVRSLLAASLREEGYTVLEACSAADASSILRGCASRIDMLITDVIMPGTSGVELAAAVEQTRPGIKALFITGYPGPELSKRGIRLDARNTLTKPCDHQVLLRAVREILDGTRGDA